MKKMLILFTIFISSNAFALDNSKIEEITGLKGNYNSEENVFKITYPRADLGIKINQWQMPAFMGLTTWVSFTEGKKAESLIMGDFVLLQDEVNPVMSTLLKSGLTITALHNHFFYDEPKVYFMHVGGEGKANKLALGIKSALDEIHKIRNKNLLKAPVKISNTSNINAKKLAKIFNQIPTEKDGMAKFVFGRKTSMSCGCEVGKEMGVNTWAAFAGEDNNALVDGDFACLENELQPVLKNLRKNNIEIVSIHNHMVGEAPRYVFLHYWAQGNANELAKKLKSTLNILVD